MTVQLLVRAADSDFSAWTDSPPDEPGWWALAANIVAPPGSAGGPAGVTADTAAGLPYTLPYVLGVTPVTVTAQTDSTRGRIAPDTTLSVVASPSQGLRAGAVASASAVVVAGLEQQLKGGFRVDSAAPVSAAPLAGGRGDVTVAGPAPVAATGLTAGRGVFLAAAPTAPTTAALSGGLGLSIVVSAPTAPTTVTSPADPRSSLVASAPTVPTAVSVPAAGKGSPVGAAPLELVSTAAQAATLAARGAAQSALNAAAPAEQQRGVRPESGLVVTSTAGVAYRVAARAAAQATLNAAAPAEQQRGVRPESGLVVTAAAGQAATLAARGAADRAVAATMSSLAGLEFVSGALLSATGTATQLLRSSLLGSAGTTVVGVYAPPSGITSALYTGAGLTAKALPAGLPYGLPFVLGLDLPAMVLYAAGGAAGVISALSAPQGRRGALAQSGLSAVVFGDAGGGPAGEITAALVLVATSGPAARSGLLAPTDLLGVAVGQAPVLRSSARGAAGLLGVAAGAATEAQRRATVAAVLGVGSGLSGAGKVDSFTGSGLLVVSVPFLPYTLPFVLGVGLAAARTVYASGASLSAQAGVPSSAGRAAPVQSPLLLVNTGFTQAGALAARSASPVTTVLLAPSAGLLRQVWADTPTTTVSATRNQAARLAARSGGAATVNALSSPAGRAALRAAADLQAGAALLLTAGRALYAESEQLVGVARDVRLRKGLLSGSPVLVISSQAAASQVRGKVGSVGLVVLAGPDGEAITYFVSVSGFMPFFGL